MRRWIAIAIALVVIGSVGYFIYDARVQTCDEWQADVKEWMRDGGAELLGDAPVGSGPKMSAERAEALMLRVRELSHTQPEGCEEPSTF